MFTTRRHFTKCLELLGYLERQLSRWGQDERVKPLRVVQKRLNDGKSKSAGFSGISFD